MYSSCEIGWNLELAYLQRLARLKSGVQPCLAQKPSNPILLLCSLFE